VNLHLVTVTVMTTMMKCEQMCGMFGVSESQLTVV